MDQEVLAAVKDVLKKKADEMGLQLVNVRFYNDAENGPTLEVFVDKDYNINLDDISKYTELVSPLLDEIPGLTDSYLLDISSGGSDRIIPNEDVKKLIGHYLDITLKKGDEKLLAKVVSSDEGGFTVLYFIKGRKKQVYLKFVDVKQLKMGYKA
jgi:ribosome maturation factor RimP